MSKTIEINITISDAALDELQGATNDVVTEWVKSYFDSHPDAIKVSE